MEYMDYGLESYGINALARLFEDWGLPRFRVNQVLEWVYGHGVGSFEQMTNLPASLRERLAAEVPLHVPHVVDKQVSADGTRKYVFELADGARVEAVGIPSRDQSGAKCAEGQARRLTVCFSTQVGCPMGCTFCATGREGLQRNLLPGEMALQLVEVGRDFGMRVSGAVGMGQGEPFLNYDNVVDALQLMNDARCLGIGARHLTVSTCGIVSGVRKLAAEPEQYTLAVSLHSAVQATRDALMPGCASTPLTALKQALADYESICGRRVSLEYLLIRDQNSDEAHLEALVEFCRGLHAHVNILPVNDVEGSNLKGCSPAEMRQWVARLEEAGIPSSVRDSRGSDIAAACGQLKNKLG